MRTGPQAPIKLDGHDPQMQRIAESVLADPQAPQLRLATKEQAEACRQQLIRRLPASEPIWIINQEVAAPDHWNFNNSFAAEVG